MNDHLESRLKNLWIAVSAVSLILPLILTKFAFPPETFGRIMEIEVLALLLLSLPSSLFVIPFLVAFKMVLEININQIEGAYFYLVLLNIIGYIQWFRLMPTYFGKAKPLKFDSILKG